MAESSSPRRRAAGWIVPAAVLLSAVLVLVLLFRDGGTPGRLLGDYEPGQLEDRVAEALDPVRLQPSRTLRLRGTDVRWNDPSGQPFLEAPRVTAAVRIGAEPDGGVLIADGRIERPRLRLVQTGEESWNYDRPLAPFFEDDGGGDGDEGGTAIRLRDMVLDSGYVRLELLDATYEARALDIRLASAQLAGPQLEAPIFRIDQANADLVLPDSGDQRVVRAVTLDEGTVRIVDGALAFQVDSATFGQSRLATLEGVWTPGGGGLGLDLRMRAVDARVADLPWLPGEVPEGATGSFDLRVEPREGDRSAVTLTDLDLRAPGSSATGSATAVIGGARAVLESVDVRVDPLSLDLVEAFTGPLPYAGSVSGTVQGTQGDIRLDLRGRLTTPALQDPFNADLTGRVALTEDGVTLRNAAVSLDRVPLAALRAVAPGLPLRGPVTGRIELDGAPGTGPLDLDLRLEAGGGIVTVAGTADLSGPIPTYDVSGRLIGVELRSVLAPPAPPTQVHATFQLEGRGLSPDSANATLRAHGTFTGWETTPDDTLAVAARVADGAVNVDELRLILGPARATAEGRWDFVDGGGTLRYALAVSRLEPLAPYLPGGPEGAPLFARGGFELAGTASGTLDAPELAGEVSAQEFRWGEWAAESLASDYELSFGDSLPRIDAALTADQVRTPAGDFEAVEVDVDFGRPEFQLAFRADQPGGRGILEVEADGRIDEVGQREVFIRSLEVDLEEQRWRLPDPAEITWTAGETVRVDGFELVQTEGEGRVAVEGAVAPMDSLDLGLEVVRLPIGDVIRLVGAELAVTGQLSLDGRVEGPATAPEVDASITLSDGSFRDVPVPSLETQIQYTGTTLRLEGQGLIGDSARIRLDGTIPARLRLGGESIFALVDDEPIDVRVVTRTFPLATLDPGLALVEDLQGRLQADLRVGGTPADPQLSGSGRLTDGALTIPLLDRRFRQIQGTVALNGRRARLEDVTVASDGIAEVTGTLSFEELTNPGLDLVAQLDGFRVQGVDDGDAAGLSGELQLEGRLAQPVLGGDLRVDGGAVSLIPLQQPELSARIADAGNLGLSEPGALDLDAPTEEGFLIRDLTVQVGDDVWFVTEEARARLGGTLEVTKTGESFMMQGTLQGEGGTFELSAGPITRQFRIVSAEIQFFGSPVPNPRLDIVASRLVRVQEGGDVDVQVQVSGTLQNPSLSLATATGANIPESELMSVLLFGRQSAELGDVTGGSGGALGLFAYSGLAEFLGAELNEEIGVFDYFRFDWLPGGVFYATAGVELLSGVFLEADIPLSDENNISAVGLEYRLEDVGTIRAAYEPVRRLDRLVGTSTLSFIRAEVERQFLLAWRRRWTY